VNSCIRGFGMETQLFSSHPLHVVRGSHRRWLIRVGSFVHGWTPPTAGEWLSGPGAFTRS